MTWRPLPDPDGRPAVPLGAGLDSILRRLGGASGPASVAVFNGWAAAVGASVAAHAQPISLRGTTLVVGVDAPAYATQLRILSGDLLARLSDLVGPGVVDAVEVRVRG